MGSNLLLNRFLLGVTLALKYLGVLPKHYSSFHIRR
jgi:hypothetical protein